ncbi:MAG: multiple sugar transport system permease protein, partial [Flavobacteriaceae bacterium]
MFPKPIEKSSASVRTSYQIILPIALFVWLLPLLAIFLTSIRPALDINAGNIFGVPSDFLLVENYTAVFTQSKAGLYLWNSIRVTIPTVILAVGLSCLTGYALSVYRFKWAIPLFFIFV